MPRSRLDLLPALLEAEQRDLARLVEEAAELAARDRVDGAVVRALGSVLHDWTTGTEKLLHRIAVDLDGSLPGRVRAAICGR